ncbi:hypothetical protein RHOSPDRAFT_26898 [Rhodotorula sp. JG-1b]|nr:hypothetical protein RHOSPDRAFT_26898 [Rhodotorula sp. JG-1b]
MSTPERQQAAAAQLAKDFFTTVGETVKERLRELEARKELPSDDATLWDLMLESPTKRLQKTESLSWCYYEPLLRGLLDEHAVDFQAEDEETARAGQWSYKLVLAELDEQIQLEREEAELALSGPWNLHAMQDAFDHQYDRDRVQELNRSIEEFVGKLSPLELFNSACEYDLHDKHSRAAYWTIYVMLGAFSHLRPAESRLPVLAARIKEAFERKVPSNLTGAYLVLIKVAEQMHIPRGEWHDPLPAWLSIREADLPHRRSRSSSISRSASLASQVEPADHGQYEPTERRKVSGVNPPAWDDWRWRTAWRSRNSYTPPQSPNGTLRRSLPPASTRRIGGTNVVALCAQRGRPPLQTHAEQQGWSSVFRSRKDELPLPPRPKDVDHHHAKLYTRTGEEDRPAARRELHANYAHEVAKKMEMGDVRLGVEYSFSSAADQIYLQRRYLEHLADDLGTHEAYNDLEKLRDMLHNNFYALFRPRLDAFFDMRLPTDEAERLDGADEALIEAQYRLVSKERHSRINRIESAVAVASLVRETDAAPVTVVPVPAGRPPAPPEAQHLHSQ